MLQIPYYFVSISLECREKQENECLPPLKNDISSWRNYYNYAVWGKGFEKLICLFFHLSTFTAKSSLHYEAGSVSSYQWYKEKLSWHWNIVTFCFKHKTYQERISWYLNRAGDMHGVQVPMSKLFDLPMAPNQGYLLQ